MPLSHSQHPSGARIPHTVIILFQKGQYGVDYTQQRQR